MLDFIGQRDTQGLRAISQKIGQFFVIHNIGLYHKPAGSCDRLMLSDSGQQRGKARQGVGKSDLSAKGHILLEVNMAETGHKGVFGDVNPHHLFWGAVDGHVVAIHKEKRRKHSAS